MQSHPPTLPAEFFDAISSQAVSGELSLPPDLPDHLEAGLPLNSLDQVLPKNYFFWVEMEKLGGGGGKGPASG